MAERSTMAPRAGACLGLILGLLLSAMAAMAQAQTVAQDPSAPDTAATEVTAGVYVSPPFVTRDGDGYAGMAIELCEASLAEREIESAYVEYETFGDLVAAVRDGAVDIAVTNLTVTETRAEFIDFTHPWFDAGLQIMISDAPRTGFGSVLGGLADTGHLRIYGFILGAIVLSTLLLTLFDRRFNPNFPKRWREGVAESFYAVMSVATTGKPPARAQHFGWVGRIWSALWLICGVAIIAYVTSSITSVMTTIALTDRISGLSDLPGKNVGVLSGSTAEEFALEQGFRTTPFPNIDAAIGALTAGRVDALVGDAPVLDYFAHTRPQHDVVVVGELFAPEKYGFGIAIGSPLRRPLTVALIGADEDGVIEELRTQYFGPRH